MYAALQSTVVGGAIAVYGPPSNASPAIFCDALRCGNYHAALTPPLFIDALVPNPVGLETLRGLEFVYFAGAPLSRFTAELLLPYTRVLPVFGATEFGKFLIEITGDDDWDYQTFRPSNGIEFKRIDGDLHEAVLVRKPELARWQQVFWVYLELEVFRTGDLWVESKTKPGAWRVIGRTDDLIVLSHGSKMNVAEVELELNRCPGVAGAVVGGQNRERPFALVEWANDAVDEKSRLERLQPAVQNVNEKCAAVVRIQKDRILITGRKKNWRGT